MQMAHLPVHCSLPLLIRGVVDIPQRMAGVPSAPVHFVRNKTEWEEEEEKRVENRKKERNTEGE